MSKKNKKRTPVDVYSINPDKLDRVLNHSDLNVESEEDEYWVDPEHPLYEKVRDDAPATRENLAQSATYEDFIHPQRSEKKNKQEGKDLKNFLKGVMEDGRDEDEEFQNEFLDGPEEEMDDYREEYEEDDPYRVTFEIKDGPVEEMEPVAEYEKPVRAESKPPRKMPASVPGKVSTKTTTSNYMVLSEICSTKFSYYEELGRLIINDSIAPISILDLNIISKHYFPYEDEDLIGIIGEGNGTDEVHYERFVDVTTSLRKYIFTLMHPCAIFTDEEFFKKFAHISELDLNSFRFFYECSIGDRPAMVYAYHIPKAQEDQLKAFVKRTAEKLIANPAFLDLYNPFYTDRNGKNYSAVEICAELLVYLYLAKKMQDHIGFVIGNDGYMNALIESEKFNLKEPFMELIRMNRRTKESDETVDEDTILERLGVYSCGEVHDMGNAILEFFAGDEDDEDLDEESSDPVSTVTLSEENPLVEAYNIYCTEAKQNPGEEILKFDEFVQQMTLASIQLPPDESTKPQINDAGVSIMQPCVDTRPVDLLKPPVPEEEPEPAKVEVMDLTKEESVSPGIGNRMMAEALEKAIQESPESNSAKMVVPVRRKNE